MKYEKNEIVTVTIEDIGSEGEGIGRVEGFTLFVKDAVVGDTVEARIVKNKKTYAYGRLEKVLVPSPFRVEPKCAWHRQCGGCQLQSCSYERQLIFKQDKIRNSLIRIGGFAPEQVDACMEPIVGMEFPFRYRNKAQYPVGTDRDGNVVAGFYAARTHNIIAHTDCWLGPVENETILNCILEYMRENKVSAYDEKTGTGLVRHILIRKGFASGEIMVCLVINGKRADFKTTGGIRTREKELAVKGTRAERARAKGPATKGTQTKETAEKEYQFLPAQDELLEKLATIKGMTSVSVSLNSEQTNVIMGKEIYTLWGKDTISDTIRVRNMAQPGFPLTGKELTFAISPLSFYQVNPVQTEKLYSLALEYAGLTGQETVWDLYCGIGTISLFLAGNAGKVYGVEVIPQAIEDARENAKRNGIENAAFFVGKAEDVLQEIYGGGTEKEQVGDEGMLHPDVIVVDPPRKGCDSACLEVMLKMRPERIVYVSCDPATLARDLKVLCQGGYEMTRARGVDQFGGTVHVEVAVLLCRTDT